MFINIKTQAWKRLKFDKEEEFERVLISIKGSSSSSSSDSTTTIDDLLLQTQIKPEVEYLLDGLDNESIISVLDNNLDCTIEAYKDNFRVWHNGIEEAQRYKFKSLQELISIRDWLKLELLKIEEALNNTKK